MNFDHLGVQMAVVLIVVAILWVVFKTLKIVWKLLFFILALLLLAFTLPPAREWLLNFYHKIFS